MPLNDFLSNVGVVCRGKHPVSSMYDTDAEAAYIVLTQLKTQFKYTFMSHTYTIYKHKSKEL